jgi:hypothetical protein
MIAAGLRLAGCIIEWRRPAIDSWCAACVGLLLLLGWWMVFNAHGRYESAGFIVPVQPWLPGAPGAVDGPVCAAAMWQITAVLLFLLVAIDRAREDVWRWRMLTTLGVTAASIAAWGLLQKAGLLPALAHRVYQESVFATFDYHGNAGAYLNLGIPALFALAVGKRALSLAGLLICLAGAMANVSRAAMVITLLLMILLIAGADLRLSARSRRRFAAGVVMAVILATLAGGGAAWRRWRDSSSDTLGPRLLMDQLSLPMARQAGLLGDGPGSFKLLYFNSPYLPRALYRQWIVAPYQIGEETSVYSHAHNDYLQFTIEWGWLGAALWAWLIVGAITIGIQAYNNAVAPQDRLLLLVALAAVAGVLMHALVNWPLQVASLQLDVAVYLALLLGRRQAPGRPIPVVVTVRDRKSTRRS